MSQDDILVLGIAVFTVVVGGGSLLYFYLEGKRLDRQFAREIEEENHLASEGKLSQQ